VTVHVRRSVHARPVRFALALFAPSVVACSLFSPSYGEFASGSTSPANGGVGAASAMSGGDGGSSAAKGGNGFGAGGATGTAGLGAAGFGAAPGEGGEAGAVDDTPAPVRSQTVAAGDIEMQKVVTGGLPGFAALVRYDIDEATAAAAAQPPLYQPYDSTAPAFWDNVLAELTQARVVTVALPSRGVFTLTTSDLTGPGNENPRRLSAWLGALDRANAADQFNAYCVVDTPYLGQVSTNFHATQTGTPFDWSQSADWTDVVWTRTIKPWFDTIPATDWWTPQNSGPVIQFSALPSTGFKNASGNLSAMLTAVGTAFNGAYGRDPSFVLDATWFLADASLASNQYVYGKSPWLTPSASSSAFSTFGGQTVGTVVPGFGAPAIARHSVDAYNNPVTTLLTGLGNAVQASPQLTVLQGFTDFADSAGFYRSNAADWSTPNEFLNLVRRFSDPKTLSVRLEAEGCDAYLDTSAGNSGKAFRRSGDLDVRALSGSGWAVTNTSAGEWIEFDNVDLSAGNYRFSAKYATGTGQTPGDGPRIELVLDGVKLPPVILDKTANADAFTTTLLVQQTVQHGPHTLRLRFLDGLVDVDWLFIEKLDVTLSLQATDGDFVSATFGGGADVNYNAMAVGIWETLSFDDLNGGDLADGDAVYIQTFNGLYVTTTGGHGVAADQRQPSDATKFTIRVQGGGSFVSGAKIALETSDAHYLTAAAAMEVDASANTVGPNQTFKVGL
jgi:hypothetical protein